MHDTVEQRDKGLSSDRESRQDLVLGMDLEVFGKDLDACRQGLRGVYTVVCSLRDSRGPIAGVVAD